MRLTASSLAGLDAVRHGFFTRNGGVSEGPWRSLNMSWRTGDAPERVARNCAAAATELGFPAGSLVTARQVHGVRAVAVAAPWVSGDMPEADALATGTAGLLVGVLSADCVPVLLADPAVPVVAAAHAGWRGALAGILEATLATMAELGASSDRLIAVVGPAIGQASYEVGPELVAQFGADCEASGAFFRKGRNDRAQLDLKGYVAWRLRRAGVPAIEVLPHDTLAEEARFFSYRRATLRGERQFGLQLSAIGLMPHSPT